MISIEITGTGSAGQIPVWGCHCPACVRAREDRRCQRRAASLAIHTTQGITLLDAGLTDLAERYPYETLRRIVLTHYHMDHVQGLFHLRWSNAATKIPVLGPDDATGCDDLFKHPGIFHFQTPLRAFQEQHFEGFSLTPVPLNHSRPTFGYLIKTQNQVVAYLTDTVGLPEQTERFLLQLPLDHLIIDCSYPPSSLPPRNHNDLTLTLEIVKRLSPKHTLLTHIGHELQCWLMENPLPENIHAAYDGMKLIN